MDDGALEGLIAKFVKKARNNERVNSAWRPRYVCVLLGACAMTLGCTIPASFKKYLCRTYKDPKETGLMRDALVQMRKALFGPDGYIDGEPYDFGTKGMRATAEAGGAAKEDRLVPWQINVASPDGEKADVLFAEPKKGIPPYALSIHSSDGDKTFEVLLSMHIKGKLEHRVLAQGCQDRMMAEHTKMVLGVLLAQKMAPDKSEPEHDDEKEEEEEEKQDSKDKSDQGFQQTDEPAPEIKIDCCGACGVEDTPDMVCAKCKTIKYCSKECQKNDWKSHKEMCKWVVKWKVVNKKETVPPGPLTAQFLEELTMLCFKSMSVPDIGWRDVGL